MFDCPDPHTSAQAILDRIEANFQRIEGKAEFITGRLKLYLHTRRQLKCCDVSRNEEYKTAFRRFYVLRRMPKVGRPLVFQILEREKVKTEAPKFEDILREVSCLTGRVEVSFSSKILATINPHTAPYDRHVREAFGFAPIPQWMSVEEKVERALCMFGHIQKTAREAVECPAFFDLARRFDSVFHELQSDGGLQEFTSTKKLDVLMWQSRP